MRPDLHGVRHAVALGAALIGGGGYFAGQHEASLSLVVGLLVAAIGAGIVRHGLRPLDV